MTPVYVSQRRQQCKRGWDGYLECVCHAASTAKRKSSAPVTALALWAAALGAAAPFSAWGPPNKPPAAPSMTQISVLIVWNFSCKASKLDLCAMKGQG